MINRSQEGTFTIHGITISDFGLPLTYLPADLEYPIPVYGTNSYSPPEIRFLAQHPTAKADIWALGCIGYELCLGDGLAGNPAAEPLKLHRRFGRQTFQHLNRLIDELRQRAFNRYRDLVFEVLFYCLQWDPAKRPDALELRTHILQYIQG